MRAWHVAGLFIKTMSDRTRKQTAGATSPAISTANQVQPSAGSDSAPYHGLTAVINGNTNLMIIY